MELLKDSQSHRLVCANGSCNETGKWQGAHLCRPKTPDRVRDARETHFTYFGRRATQINRIASLLETGRVKRVRNLRDIL